MKSHNEISRGNIIRKYHELGNIMKSLKPHKARNLMRKSHTQNVQQEPD
jgi:hypothetical protein